MPKVSYRYFFYIIPLVILFGISLPLIKIIRITLKYDPTNNDLSKATKFSYVILSSDDKVLSKLSRKFEINNSKHKIPYLLKYSFISAEDKKFYKHNGIDLASLFRAFISNMKSGYLKEGGSTITQQVARLIFLNNDLNFQRKIKEIFISLILDLRFSKNQILKIYLNNIYLGSGAYGVNEAAQVYFGKLLNELTLSEIALIAGLAPAPSIFSPFENIDLAIKNRNIILEKMYLDGYISSEEKKNALNEKISLNYHKSNDLLNDKLLISLIIEETNKKIENENTFKFLKIKSSINKDWQESAQKISEYVEPKNIELALLSIESNTGLIRTMITGKNSSINEFNRVQKSIRPLGSTFKIIPYAAALIEGIKLSDKFYDVPTCWEDYCPKNFANNYRGKISLIESFKSSSNIVPIKISKEIGNKKIINLANNLGLGQIQKLEEFRSLAIGSFGDNLLNITNIYAGINNNGRLYKTSILEKIEQFNGQTVWENKFISKQIFDLKVNDKLKKILENTVTDGTAIAASISGKKIFGKTGTSDGNRDLWFIGSIENLTTGVWIGFDENKESKLSSGNAASLWKEFIVKIYNIQIKK